IAGAAVEGAEAAPAELHGPPALLAGRDLLGRRRGGILAVRGGGGGRRLVEVPRVLALRVVAAADEGAEAAEAHEELPAVLGAELVDRHPVAFAVRHLLAGGLQVAEELLVEVGDGVLPVDLALFDTVELPFELGRVALVDDVVET